MKNKTLSKIIRLVCFLSIAVLLFSSVSFLLERKTAVSKTKDFYTLEQNSLDYVCVGSSHAYCTVNPVKIWQDTGLRGYVLATQEQPLEASYYHLKEAFKTQSPKVVILEGYMAKLTLDKASDAALFDAIDPIKLSKNKYTMICDIIPEGNREAYFFNLLKYHTRWKEFINSGVNQFFDEPIKNYNGYSAFLKVQKNSNKHSDYEKVKEQPIDEQNLEYMNKILELTKENNAELLLLIAPYEANNPQVAGIMKSEREWAKQNDVSLLDYSLLLDQIKIDGSTDYYDSGHLNVSGAYKASGHLADYLLEMGLVATENTTDAVFKTRLNDFLALAENNGVKLTD